MSKLRTDLILLVRDGLENQISHKGYFELRNKWALLYNNMARLVAEMEVELQTMKDKGLPNPVLEKKDKQIQTIVDFYNYTEIIFKTYDENLKDLTLSKNFHQCNDHETTQLLIKNLQYIAKHFKKQADGPKS